RGMVGALSTSQFISLFIFAGGLLLLIICASKKLPPFGSRELDQDHPFNKDAKPADTAAPADVEAGTADAEENSEETVKPEA
ncbi:MAG: hypothetical protein J6Z38_07770, partial [Lachnospiraceae bacterium]|nr:hypothetical protein [Lachnospiraceae bacterium]